MSLRTHRLEALLVVALIALLLQVFPGSAGSVLALLLESIDVRNWGFGTRVAANLVFLFALITIRFRDDLRAAFTKVGSKLSSLMKPAKVVNAVDDDKQDPERQKRIERDAEWRERAKNRLPYT